MIITALDTGTRQGEMLALRFGDIDSEAREPATRSRASRKRQELRSDTAGFAVAVKLSSFC